MQTRLSEQLLLGFSVLVMLHSALQAEQATRKPVEREDSILREVSLPRPASVRPITRASLPEMVIADDMLEEGAK